MCSQGSLSIKITFYHLSLLICLSKCKLCPIATEVISKVIDFIASSYNRLHILHLSHHCGLKPPERDGQALSIMPQRKGREHTRQSWDRIPSPGIPSYLSVHCVCFLHSGMSQHISILVFCLLSIILPLGRIQE